MRKAAGAGLGALLVIFIACTWTGIDFGNHWDENPMFLLPAAKAIRSGTVLPGTYVYPSVLHDITLAALVPEALRGREVAAQTAQSKPFKLRMRRLVALITALTIVWVFLLVLVWRESPLEALLAAAIAAGSWELQYHSRWITVDPLVVYFAALTILCAVSGHRRGSPWLLRASAVAAGLACSSKYPAGLLLLTVLLACWFSSARVRRMAEGLVLFALTFLVATPALVFDTSRMLHDIRFAARAYATGWGVYTVSGPFEHARLLAEYVALVLPSHTPLIAAFFALAALGGLVAVLRDDRRTALIVLAFPVVYLLYFTTQRVMIVRNVLVVMPFLATLAAIGLGTLLKRGIRASSLRIVAAAGIAAMLLVNLAWLWTAARTIKRPPAVHLTQLAAYLDAHPDRRFALSPRVAAELQRFDGRSRPLLSPQAPGVDAIVYFALEVPHAGILPNRRNTIERWFGAHEINVNYYPTWPASDRVLVVSRGNIAR